MKKRLEHITYAFLIIFVMFLIVNKSTAVNETTNWIIAIANVVMAGAAITGVVYARKYVNELATKDGYEAAVQLKEEILPHLKPDFFGGVTISNMNHGVKLISEKPFSKRDCFVHFMESFKVCDAECVRFQELLFEFDKVLRRLSTCGWGVVSGKQTQYEKLIESARNYSMALQVLTNYTGSFMMDRSIFKDDFPKKVKQLNADELVTRRPLFQGLDEESKLNVINFVSNYSTAKDELNKSHAAYFEGEPHLFKFFAVK